mmetsp:Transcript_34887/g.44033  ORF Transcript_34887/g.44033 Transcript_34887/m.44033 type:complete len:347 (-) Transcript_34887:113-1153(-)
MIRNTACLLASGIIAVGSAYLAASVSSDPKNESVEDIAEKKHRVALADEKKVQGNAALKEGKLGEAKNLYTEAIYLSKDGVNSHLYFTNRAYVNILQSLYEAAIHDAQEAIKLKRDFSRAWLRLGEASMELNRYKEARDAFSEVLKMGKTTSNVAEEVSKKREICIDLLTKQSNCPGKHGLNHLTSNPHSCDVCLEIVPKDAKLYGCRACNYDVCVGCFDANAQTKCHELFCKLGHGLKLEYYFWKKKCLRCCQAGSWMYGCSECVDLYLCGKCHKFFEEKEEKGYRKEKRSEENGDCVICFDSACNTLLLPCKHLCVCCECSTNLDNCPICRSTIENVIDGIFSA